MHELEIKIKNSEMNKLDAFHSQKSTEVANILGRHRP
jgi:hypothetical protein